MNDKCPECDNPYNGYKCRCGHVSKSQPMERPARFCSECGFGGVIIGTNGKDRAAFRCSCDNGGKMSARFPVWKSDIGWQKVGPFVYDKYAGKAVA